jgi:hypothetical protein
VALFSGSAAVAVWWCGAQWRDPDGWLAAGSLLAGLAAAALARRHVVEPVRLLGWDGSGWSLADVGGEPRAGQVRLMLDLGGWMLLRFSPDGAGRRAAWRQATWLTMSAHGAAGTWHALRVALHAAQPAQPAA